MLINEKKQNLPNHYHLKRSRKYLPIPASWNVSAITDKRVADTYGVGIQFYVNFFTPSGDVFAVYNQADWDRFGNFIVKKIKKKKQFFKQLQQKHKKAEIELLELINELENKTLPKNTAGFIKLYKRIKSRWIDYNVVSPPIYFVGSEYIKNDLETTLKKYITDQKVINDLIGPIKKSWALKEELDICIATLKKLNKKNKFDIENISQMLSKIYGWMPVSYDANEYWDARHYRKIIEENVGSKTKKEIEKVIYTLQKYEDEKNKKIKYLIKRHSLTDDVIRQVEAFQGMYILQDDRKYVTSKLHWVFRQFLEAFAKKISVEYMALKYFDIGEIESFIDTPQKIAKLYKIRSRSYLLYEGIFGKKPIFMSGNDAHKRFQKFGIFTHKNTKNLNFVAGTVASRPNDEKIIRGRAKIILIKNKKRDVKKEDIIITTMTTPDAVFLIKKARGVVTDEGGITSHAALLSREFLKPCIVGTKIATSVFKDGDHIEMDMSRGIINKII